MRMDILSPLDSQVRCFSDMFVCGLIMSSTVTAVIALMLEETVLGSTELEGGEWQKWIYYLVAVKYCTLAVHVSKQ